MSLTELANTLERSFRTSSDLLTELQRGLEQRRSAWISARPDTITPSADLEQLAARLATEDEVRNTLVAEVAELLPTRGSKPTDLRVNVSRIAAALPRAAADSLRRAAADATRKARAVRTELALGRRLLEFSQRTHEGLLGELSAQPPAGSAKAYDRSANRRPVAGPASATIIDGRM